MPASKALRGSPRLTLTIEALAHAQDVDGRTVRRWIRAGCPVAEPAKRGHRGARLDPAEVATWRARGLSDQAAMVQALCGKLDARARQLARKLATLEEEHLEAAQVQEAWPRYVEQVRTRCARVPAELAERLLAVAGQGEPVMEAALRAAVHELLTELAGSGEGRTRWARRARPVAGSRTLREARTQLATIETALIETRERVSTGDLVAVVDVERAWIGRIVVSRARMLAWPATLCEKLYRATVLGDPLEPLLQAAVEDALRELEDRRRAPTRGGHDADDLAPLAPASSSRASRPGARGRHERPAQRSGHRARGRRRPPPGEAGGPA